MTRIAYFGSCWPTNIGNGFVSVGAINQLRKVLGPDVEIHHIGAMSQYLFWRHGAARDSYDFAEHGTFDYVALGGMTQCVDYWVGNAEALRCFTERGAKLVLLGAGAGVYDDDETRRVRELMSEHDVHALISRDRFSYEAYRDAAVHAFDGIDSAFFTNDAFPVFPYEGEPYVVATFDGLDALLRCDDGRVLRPAAPDIRDEPPAGGLFGRRPPAPAAPDPEIEVEIDLAGRRLVLAHHAPWPEFTRASFFSQPDTLISDLPTDYLSLYANCDIVHSDRIHACIAALAFGREARLYGRDVPRLSMFERVGAGAVLERAERLDAASLDEMRAEQLAFLAGCLEC